jgi:2-polyprenyl-6-methoxyphenol hydroxylase-like FAD-dependent oxidoreductase
VGSRKDAVVVGAGIGGLAVAAGLVRAGWHVQVLERAEALAPLGAGIALTPNAVKALDWLGLGTPLRTRARAQGAAGVRTAGGRWLMRTNVDALTERFGVPAFALHRGDLQQMLLDAARDADIRTGHRVTAVHEDGDRVGVEFEAAGRHGAAAGSVVITADGIGSTVRSLLFPDHPGPAPAGYTTWRSVVDPRVATAVGRPASVTETWGRGHRFGIVPLADGRITWFATTPTGRDAPDDLAALAARFERWHDPIPELLAATAPEALLRHDIAYLREPLPTYTAGRIALLGDAAHAVTPDLGQGGAMALEDATELTAALTRDAQDVPRALAAYDAARRPRTQSLVRASARVARIAQLAQPAAAFVRDLTVRLTPASLYLRSSEPALSWQPPQSTANT